MKKTFALNTEPHVADVGGTELLFQPEVMGDDFMDAYAELREAQRGSGVDPDDLSDADPGQLRQVSRALRGFLAHLMLPESAELLTRLDVVADGAVIASFQDLEEAQEHADHTTGAKVVDGLRLPDRVLVELMEWVIELYGGGERPPMSSSVSAKASPPAGRPGTGASRSRGSTRTRGR
ncbi:hypothetical protein PH213_20275 [Streptomyces sp. SRF1]|uniref:hypothetical protein n=1 Tax=Streptomyces sp. SRF1 TaxID=1549642 RepID=UPI0025AFC6A9|nr:hypothetical protein [Streptomyces sp. SRF1]MDN3056843.1 hypothetical protein [Streptomyces sp. SRF1]